MARVNIEEHCFGESRLRKLGKLLRSEQEALGTLAFLWFDSQELLRVDGTKEEIIDWCHAWDDGEKVFSALLQTGYISKKDSKNGQELYLIHGNEEQIKCRVSNMDRAKKGGDATKKKWEQIRKQNEQVSVEASSPHQASSEQAGSLAPARPNTIQVINNTNMACADAHTPDVSDTSDPPPNVNANGNRSHPPSPSHTGIELDFEALYALFPKREKGKDMRKAKGMEKCERQIKTKEHYENLKKAVLNYAAHVKEQKRKDPLWRYSVQWGTFMEKNYWVDWIDPGDEIQKPQQGLRLTSNSSKQKQSFL